MMSWLAFSFLTMLLVTISSLVEKKTLLKQHAMEFSCVLAIFLAIISSPLLFTIDYSQIDPGVLGLIYITSIFGALAFLMVAKAIRHMPISAASPLMVLGPGVTAVAAFLLIGEELSSIQVLGLGFLILGTYIVEIKTKKDLLHPFKRLFSNKYGKLILLSLVLYSITSTIDKKILGSISEGGFGLPATTYIPLVHIFIALNYLLLITFFYEGVEDVRHGIKNFGIVILIIAFLTFSYRLSQAHALTFPGSKVALVSAIKKSSALLTTFIGGELFNEKGLMQKTIACAVMLVGAFLIISQ